VSTNAPKKNRLNGYYARTFRTRLKPGVNEEFSTRQAENGKAENGIAAMRHIKHNNLKG
jgi:hypothetical protein